MNIIIKILQALILWPFIFFLRIVNFFFPKFMWNLLVKSTDMCPMTYEEMKENERLSGK